jgi:hypothetical protein
MGNLQPITISIQQMALSYSMIVLPCKHENGFFFCLNSSKVAIQDGSYSGADSDSRYSMSPSGGSKYSAKSSERSVYEQGLESVLATNAGVKKFAEHCAREFSIENIRFWQAVNQYREMFAEETEEVSMKGRGANQTRDSFPVLNLSASLNPLVSHFAPLQHMKETALHIYDEYVKPGCDMQVNLPMTMVKLIKKQLEEDAVKVDLLDEGQREIFNLMSRDSYQRFLNARTLRQNKSERTRRGSSGGGRRRSIGGF